MTKKDLTIKCQDCGEEFCSTNEVVCPKCRRKKKWRTIKACRELAAKYREPEGRCFFEIGHCSICDIHYKDDNWDRKCVGCPLANECGGGGCGHFASNYTAQEYLRSHQYNTDKIILTNPAFDARAAFFDKIIPILDRIPAERFTKRGWKYFNELDRSW